MSKYKAKRLAEFFKTVEPFSQHIGDSAADTRSLRILTWNVFLFQFVHDKLDQLVDIFNRANADIVCLQEVDAKHPAYKKLLVHLQENGYKHHHFTKSFKEEGLLTASKYPVEAWAHVYMPGHRCALLAKLSQKNPTCQKISIVNGHMDCQDLTGTMRRSQLQVLLEFCDIESTILVGDMNACHPRYETEDSWKRIQKHDQDDRNLVTPTLFFDLIHEHGLQSVNSPLTVPVTVWSFRVVDHVVLPKAFFHGSAAVVKTILSDHLPVVADIMSHS